MKPDECIENEQQNKADMGMYCLQWQIPLIKPLSRKGNLAHSYSILNCGIN